jgi:hypothetical protein
MTLFKRWTILNEGRWFFAISTRFPPRLNLWFWFHNDERFFDLRVWPIDIVKRKLVADQQRFTKEKGQ